MMWWQDILDTHDCEPVAPVAMILADQEPLAKHTRAKVADPLCCSCGCGCSCSCIVTVAVAIAALTLYCSCTLCD